MVSLFVDGKKFSPSVHGSVGCTGCHADLEGKDLPHRKPAKVNCGNCHTQEQELYSKFLARQSGCAWRPTGAALRELSREPRYCAGQG